VIVDDLERVRYEEGKQQFKLLLAEWEYVVLNLCMYEGAARHEQGVVCSCYEADE
jgi:hypothetical protein